MKILCAGVLALKKILCAGVGAEEDTLRRSIFDRCLRCPKILAVLETSQSDTRCVSAASTPSLREFSFQRTKEKTTIPNGIVVFSGALKKIRTPDLLVRSQTLYPAELSAHAIFRAKV